MEINTAEVKLMDEEKGQVEVTPRSATWGGSAPTSPRTALNRSQSLDMDAEDIDVITSNLFQVNPYRSAGPSLSNGTALLPKNGLGGSPYTHTVSGSRRRLSAAEEYKSDEVLMLEITADGKQSFKNMRLRDLLDYVNAEARKLDSQGGGYGVGKQRDKQEKGLTGAGSGSNLSQAMDSNTEAQDSYCSAANPLRLRDLRRLEARFDGSDESTLLVRWHAILISLEPIMAIVMTNRIILLVPDGADSLLSLVEDHMMLWVESKQQAAEQQAAQQQASVPVVVDSTPFEVHAYDAMLTTVSSLLSREYTRFEREVDSVLTLFKQKGLILSVDAQENMRSLKNQASRMLTRLTSFRRALEDLVEDDEDMALMNLTLLKRRPRLYQYPLSSEVLGKHEEIEELLENYLNDYNSIESKLLYQKQQMQSAEELLRIRLDTARNTLLLVNTQFGILACAIAFGSFVVGGFGMNLTTELNAMPGLFALVFALTFVVIMLLFAVVVLYLRTSGTLPVGSN